ncbi:extracellular solute-binding protein [Arthrobacter crystallopoietes BAB-32]|uniref:Extracellular solute-binding protein n=1 Tax=Arthrobacter crystallopoietes BAB-32 TaxID=1246476 RepID=N1V3S2_9MICC|nr:extracellular solute-binding protein [Arthrobacter crystallopoietes]EMY34717.1 extracellular solute-binding protein [Arthrobacter crystallopoietes BAB-32]
MSRRPSAAILSVAASALLLTACATGTGGSDTASEAEFDPEAEVAGALSVMGFGTNDEIAETRLDLAKEALPEVDISLVEGDLDIQQFLSAVATGEPPELIYANRDQLGTFASRGAIIPLDRCIEGEGISIGDFREPAIAQVTLEDQVYGIPEFNQVQVVMANAGLLEDAGVGLEELDGSNWDSLAAASAKLAKDDGGKLSVIGYDSKLPEFLPLWAKANGADLISANGRTAQLDDPKVVEALEFAVGIYEEQGGFSAVKSFRDSADFFGAGNQFASNSLGAMPMEQWYINILNDVSPDASLAFTPFKAKDGTPLSFASGSAWAIPSGSANPEAACRFIKTMTQTDTWMAAAKARADVRAEEGKPFTGLFTGNATADEQIRSEFVKPVDEAKWDDAINASYEANENSFSLPANPADAEFKTAWLDAVNRVLNGQAEPAESLQQAQQEAQQALDAAWEQWDQRE